MRHDSRAGYDYPQLAASHHILSLPQDGPRSSDHMLQGHGSDVIRGDRVCAICPVYEIHQVR